MRIVILITGPSGSGKTTKANALYTLMREVGFPVRLEDGNNSRSTHGYDVDKDPNTVQITVVRTDTPFNIRVTIKADATVGNLEDVYQVHRNGTVITCLRYVTAMRLMEQMGGAGITGAKALQLPDGSWLVPGTVEVPSRADEQLAVCRDGVAKAKLSRQDLAFMGVSADMIDKLGLP